MSIHEARCEASLSSDCPPLATEPAIQRVTARSAEIGGGVTVSRVLPSRANFLCVAFDESARVQRDLLAAGVVVRDVGRHPLLTGFLRISIGRREENARVLEVLIRREYGR